MRDLFQPGVMTIDGLTCKLLTLKFADVLDLPVDVIDKTKGENALQDFVLAVDVTASDALPKFMGRYDRMCSTLVSAKPSCDYSRITLRTLLANGQIRLVNTFAYHSFAGCDEVLRLCHLVDVLNLPVDRDNFFSDSKSTGEVSYDFLLTFLVSEVRRVYSNDVEEAVTKLHSNDYPLQVLVVDGVQCMCLALETGILPIWSLT